MPEFYDIEPSLMGGMRAPSAAFYLPEDPDDDQDDDQDDEEDEEAAS